MVKVGDRVYRVEFYKVRSGTIVKKSWVRNKAWIKTDDTSFTFEVPLSLIGRRYHTKKKNAIESAINELEVDLFLAEHECKRISEIKEAISYWKGMLERGDSGD